MQSLESSYIFRIDPEEHQFKKTHPVFVDKLTQFINASKPIACKEDYVAFVGGITDIITQHARELAVSTPLYDKELERIGKNELTFATPWGGVAFKEVSIKRNHVEKYLVVEQAVKPTDVLGFEYHHKKDERLRVEEGYAIFIASDLSPEGLTQGRVTMMFAGQGSTCELHPETKHGVIALTNLVLLETSTCDLDREDLLFVF